MLIPTVRVSVAYNSGAAIVIALFAVVISALESAHHHHAHRAELERHQEAEGDAKK